jgi:outer membrane protein TolC
MISNLFCVPYRHCFKKAPYKISNSCKNPSHMKPIFKFIFVTGLSIVLFNTVTAQIPQDSIYAKTAISFPPLNDVIDSALKHNALVQFRSLEIDAKAANLTSKKNNWLRNLGLQGDSRYGNIDAFSTNANGVSSSVLNTSSRQFNYAAGVYIKIPLYDIINRKTDIKQAKTELEQAKAMVTAQQDELRQLVIRQYEEVLLKQKLLSIKSQNLGSAAVNMEMVEKEFRNGVIQTVEYVRISDINARIQSDYEIAKSDFLLAKKILEEMAGYSFSTPNSKRP